MKNVLLFFVGIVVVFGLCSCQKELDLNRLEYYNVHDFLNSKNCNTKCGNRAECEGQLTRLKGFIDEFHTNRESNTFYLFDLNKSNVNIEVKVDSTISDFIFDFIQANSKSNFKIKGIIEGYDRPTNFTCTRGFIIHLLSEKDLEVE